MIPFDTLPEGMHPFLLVDPKRLADAWRQQHPSGPFPDKVAVREGTTDTPDEAVEVEVTYKGQSHKRIILVEQLIRQTTSAHKLTNMLGEEAMQILSEVLGR